MTSLNSESDFVLVKRLQEGDVKVLETFMEKYQGRIYRLALRVVGNPEDAEEICQDTFFAAYRKIHTFKGHSAFYSWLYRIALNYSFMKLRKNKRLRAETLKNRTPDFVEDGEQLLMIPDRAPRADEIVLEKQLRAYLNEYVNELSEKYRTVFVLGHNARRSSDELAASLGLSVPAVKSRLRRARLTLRRRLSWLFSEGILGSPSPLSAAGRSRVSSAWI